MLATLTADRQGRHSRPCHAGGMTGDDALPAASLARKAWRAWIAGDTAAAQSLARAASAAARTRPRRERQLVQIVQLAVDGDTTRASGLIAEHLAEFPGDACD
jgi:hypothetical protein